MRQFLTERSYSIDFSVLVAMLHEHEKLILVCTLSQAGFNWCLHNKSRSGCKMALKLASAECSDAEKCRAKMVLNL